MALQLAPHARLAIPRVVPDPLRRLVATGQFWVNCILLVSIFHFVFIIIIFVIIIIIIHIIILLLLLLLLSYLFFGFLLA